MKMATPRTALFGPYALDQRSGELRKFGTKVKMGEQAFQILRMLLETPGEMVTREELRAKLWATDTFVDFDHGLNSAVQRLRDCLSDSAGKPRWVETIPRRGYRFIGQVEWSEESLPSEILSNPGNAGVQVESSDDEAQASVGLEASDASRRVWGVTRRIAMLAVAVLIALLAALPIVRRIQGASAAKRALPIKSLAVLPLANFSGDPNQEYFVDGMTDKLITNLAQLSSLRVVSRTSIMQYKNSRKPLLQIARELQVDAVVEGSVVRSGDQVRITAQLIDARDDRHLWAQSYDRDLRDILQLQGGVAGDIAEKVSSNLLSAQAQPPSSAARSLNLAAYDDYLKGRYYSQRLTNADLIKGIGYLERSIQQDPNYAPAYTDLAISYAALGSWFGWSPPGKEYPKAKAAALRALALDPNLAEAHTVLGWLYEEWEWNWAGARKELQLAVDLNPNSSFAHSRFAVYLVTTGQNDKAESETKRTLELDPLSPLHRSTAAYVFICLRQYDRAIQEARRAIEIDPTFADAHVNLATALGAKGLYQEAFSEWLQYLNLSGDGELAQQLTVAAKEVSGSSYPGRKISQITLRYFQKKSRTRYVSPLFIAGTYLILGDKDHAFEWLDKAYQERSPVLSTIKTDPSWDPLRSDPRFDKLIRKIGFPN
jgi:TolB-like protein/DNA-binding winged helix-turn-helix (wHTH) protein/tetratricopeptide (TPR) repeat protein